MTRRRKMTDKEAEGFFDPFDEETWGPIPDPLAFVDFEYHVAVLCPLCGSRVGFVEKRVGHPQKVEEDVAGHVHGALIGWPTERVVERAVLVASRRPGNANSRPGEDGFNGHAGRVMARRLP